MLSNIRRLIREYIESINEGGHGGQPIFMDKDTFALYKHLEDYSKLRKSSPPDVDSLIEFIDDGHRKTFAKNLIAYRDLWERADEFLRGRYPQLALEFGVTAADAERQVMKILGAEFNRNNDPSSGFSEIFGTILHHSDVEASPAPSRAGGRNIS